MKKYSCGNIVDLTDAEVMEIKEKQQTEINVDLTPEERLAELESLNQMLTQCLMEMSQIVYA